MFNYQYLHLLGIWPNLYHHPVFRGILNIRCKRDVLLVPCIQERGERNERLKKKEVRETGREGALGDPGHARIGV